MVLEVLSALRERAWAPNENMTAPNMTLGDALFVALAEILDEPLATRDRALPRAVRAHTDVEITL